MPTLPLRLTTVSRGLAAAAAAAALAALAACASGGSPATPSGPDRYGVPVAPGLRGYPFAASRITTQDYFGTVVSDDFDWLENAGDTITRNWMSSEYAYGRRYLDAMPARAALRQRLQALIGSTGNSYTALVERGGVLFALKSAPGQQRPVLVILKSVDELGSERVVYDPNEQSADGSLAIDFMRPSPDGRRVAVALSGGVDGDSVRVVDLGAGGQTLPDTLARVAPASAGGDVAWSSGGAGLFYTRSAAPGAPGPQLLFHKLGTPAAQDREETGASLPPAARVRLDTSRDGRNLLALVENGRNGDASLYLKPTDANGDGAWRRLAADSDGVREAQFGDDDAIWIRSVANAPRGKLLRLPIAETKAINWDKLPAVATPIEGALQRFAVASGTLYVAEGQSGPTRLRLVDVRSRHATTVALPPGSGIAALARVGKNDVVAQVTNYLEAPLWSRVGGGRVKRTAMVSTSDANFNDTELVREFATSRDGTPVSIDVLRRKGMRLDGRNPVLLMPAGSLGSGTTPDFDPARRVWLDRGGVIALATLRGAVDGGEAWHADGIRAKRQNMVDDLVACADALVKRGYTRPALLGLRARGDGAFAVVAAAVQRPELFRAVAAASGRYDLLRLERDPTGAADAPEFGTPRDRAQFEALAAVSPLRGVRDGAAYPAMLLLAGERDGRVDPSQSRKMVARLQQANPSGRPVLMWHDNASGQGAHAALNDAVEQASDEFGFLLHEVVAAQ